LRLIQKTKLLEGNKIKLSDIDRLFITTNYNPNESTADNNPLKSLVRYEFIEILVRLAHEKYPNVSYTEAFAICYENDFREHFLTYGDSNEWRLDKYNLNAYIGCFCIEIKNVSFLLDFGIRR